MQAGTGTAVHNGGFSHFGRCITANLQTLLLPLGEFPHTCCKSHPTTQSCCQPFTPQRAAEIPFQIVGNTNWDLAAPSSGDFI